MGCAAGGLPAATSAPVGRRADLVSGRAPLVALCCQGRNFI